MTIAVKSKFIKTSKVAKLLGISPVSIRYQIKQGLWNHVKIGHVSYIPLEQLYNRGILTEERTKDNEESHQ